MARGALLTDADRTAIRAAIAAGGQPAEIAKRLGRSTQTVKNFASKHGLKFDAKTKKRRGRPPKPKPEPPPAPPPPETGPIPADPVEKLHWLLDNACQRAAAASDTKEFGLAAKAASDTVLALNRLPAAEPDDGDDDFPAAAGLLS